MVATSLRCSPPPPPGPKPIRRLQESVINRIAAGEIIHRPSSALKELIENSLDAGSTSIKVTVKDGGMKLLQIQDNGCGIRKADLPLLAERFTTSKLSTFSDLKHLTTYGFRGEALASISYVSNLNVVTKTKTDTCNEGTTITVENLFYNTPTRLSALRGSSEEYSRILEVVTKYAVHNPHVSFTCKKSGTPSPDVSTPSSSTTVQAIRLVYGQTLAKELLHVVVSSSKQSSATSEDAMDAFDEESDDDEAWNAEIRFTNASYQAKKTALLLFINHRLVESSRIKRALEGVYSGILAKGASPFIYLSLRIDPRAVDVNVHPTKKEVHFLNEDTIIERIADAVQQALLGKSQSRAFEYQKSKGKRKAQPDDNEVMDDEEEGADDQVMAAPQLAKRKVYAQHKVRTSLNNRTLDSMFPVIHPSQKPSLDSAGNHQAPATPSVSKDTGIKESETILTSIRQLRADVLKAHTALTEILNKHTFVGVVDIPRCLSLVQHGTRLYLLNHGALSAELFYQLGLRQFGNFSRIRLDPPPELRMLVALAVSTEEAVSEAHMDRDVIVDHIVSILMSRRDMLQEYFNLGISEDGHVETLPLLLRDYTPNLDKLPLFLMRLGPQVDWTAEKECFESFLRELAYFYVPEPLLDTAPARSANGDAEALDGAAQNATLWQIQHALFPAMARYLVADLPELYKVFERC
ncbi:DNA binding protein [Epithele typhae]|uniref:DNA binding protein n=1 Tax=Epithele typhae TaxID=378194 RepID=UPI002007EFFE|nr:DNA binding protein [Epithele typhae]KAH9941321.1 DNA binding protein [Epithele typhae]